MGAPDRKDALIATLVEALRKIELRTSPGLDSDTLADVQRDLRHANATARIALSKVPAASLRAPVADGSTHVAIEARDGEGSAPHALPGDFA